MPSSHVFGHVDKPLTQMSQDPDGKCQALKVWLAQFAKEAIISWSDHPVFFYIYSIGRYQRETGTAVDESCDNEQVKNSKVEKNLCDTWNFDKNVDTLLEGGKLSVPAIATRDKE